MRKQVDFDVRVFQISANPEQNGGMTHDQVSAFVRENYLKNGWEVLSAQNVQIAANAVSVQVNLVKYEDVVEPTPTKAK